MKRKRFTEEQIAFALRQLESGTPVVDVVRKLGIKVQTFDRCKKYYAGLRLSPSTDRGVNSLDVSVF